MNSEDFLEVVAVAGFKRTRGSWVRGQKAPRRRGHERDTFWVCPFGRPGAELLALKHEGLPAFQNGISEIKAWDPWIVARNLQIHGCDPGPLNQISRAGPRKQYYHCYCLYRFPRGP